MAIIKSMRNDFYTFQSAPPTEAGGDEGSFLATGNTLPVSIRSPHRSRGRCNDNNVTRTFERVSIRSPHRSRGRFLRIERRRRSSFCFNPLPPPKQGEIGLRLPIWRVQRCFNPLPPPKQGEISRSPLPVHSRESFNPLPPPKQGEIG